LREGRIEPGHGADVLDLIGIGVGPANLSLAALLEGAGGFSSLFFEQKPAFSWHPGLLLPGVTTQVHFLKDLVTLVDPNSRFSFLSFLASKRRLYRAIIAGRIHASRAEFDQYYRWAASQLPNIKFGAAVSKIGWDDDELLFAVTAGGRRFRSRNLVVATGLPPYVPACVEPLLGDRAFHAAEFLFRQMTLPEKRVAVIGGGQTGAEVVHHLLTSPERPRRLVWVTKRLNFLPLDDTPFTNELFLPNYSRYFSRLPERRRLELLPAQELASNGIDVDLLQAIYRRLYDLECVEGEHHVCRLAVAHQLVDAADDDDQLVLTFRNLETGAAATVTADAVILATGYRSDPPAVLGGLLDRIAFVGGRLSVREDFSLEWDGPDDRRIYVQNAAPHRFGVADPNLSLLSWRSATIVNSVAGQHVYELEDEGGAIDWKGLSSDAIAERALAAAAVDPAT
jgi:lysine N6-hydroxylase